MRPTVGFRRWVLLALCLGSLGLPPHGWASSLPVGRVPSSPLKRAQALIQTGGPPLRAGRIRGGALVPLQRAKGGDTPVLTFASVRGPVRLLLDTGAAAAMVTPQLAQRLGLPLRPLPPKSFSLAGGGRDCPTLSMASTRLPELRLGAEGQGPPLRLVGLDALVLPVRALPEGVDGVLGAPSLRQVPVVVDPVAEQVALGPPALRWRQARAGGGQVLPLRWRHGVPLLCLAVRSPATASWTRVNALADTGAEGLFLTPALAATLTPLQTPSPARLVGVCGEQAVLRQSLLGVGLGSGEPTHPAAEAILLENPVFSTLAVQAIVGQELLRQHRQLWRLDAEPPRLELW